MITFRQTDMYNPGYMGVNDVLVCGGRVEAMGDHLERGSGCSEIDTRGYLPTPSLIDQRGHIIGGGGEGSSHTRTPKVQLSALIQAGITTVLRLSGTDNITGSIENLVTRTEGLREEGVAAFTLCGAYGYPPPIVIGNVKKGIVSVNETLGLELVLSDHGAPNVPIEELVRFTSDVCTAGMIGEKPEFIILHMGNGERRLDRALEASERTNVPVKTFHLTHTSRTSELLQSGFRLAKMSGYMDITCEGGERIQNGWPGAGRVMGTLKGAGSQEVPMDRTTFSSDGRGSWSSYDRYGHLKEIGVMDMGNIYRQLKYLVVQGKMDLSEALPFFTSSAAKALKMYPRKGCIAPGVDADLLLIRPDMTLDTVTVGGRVVMAEGNLRKKGTYEAEH